MESVEEGDRLHKMNIISSEEKVFPDEFERITWMKPSMKTL
jgi:hypothetical protein